MFLFSSIIASLVLHFILYDKNMLTKHKNMVLDGPGGFYRPNDPTNSVKYWMKEWSLTSGFNPTRLISQFYSKTTCKNTQNILNLSTVKLVGGYKDQPADMYELPIMTVHNWEQLCCTVQFWSCSFTDQMLSIGQKGKEYTRSSTEHTGDK